jgi:hypothetical protein
LSLVVVSAASSTQKSAQTLERDNPKSIRSRQALEWNMIVDRSGQILRICVLAPASTLLPQFLL